MQLANTTAIVTGGASGLGAATAAALAAQGARVVALDLPDACASGPAVEGVEYVPTDVTAEAGALARITPYVTILAETEGLSGHAASIRMRGTRKQRDG